MKLLGSQGKVGSRSTAAHPYNEQSCIENLSEKHFFSNKLNKSKFPLPHILPIISIAGLGNA